MQYLVTGGSGFLGLHVIRHLVSKGHQVVSLDRTSSNPILFSEQVNSIKADIRDKELLLNALKRIDIVIHTAAAQPTLPEEEILSIDVDGTRNVMEAALKNGVKRVVHISSASVYGMPSHSPIYESDKLIPDTSYAKGKILSEEVCLDFRKQGLCIPILRPKKFIGPERLGLFHILFDWANEGKNFPIIGKGNNHYQLLDIDDLCEAIYLTATLDKSVVNDTFNIGAKEFMSTKEDYQAVLDYAGYGKRIVTTPEAPIILSLRLLEMLKLAPIYKWVYETAAKECYLSVEKAEKVLSFKPKYSNQEMLIKYYRWYVDNIKCVKKDIKRSRSWKERSLSLVKVFF